MAKHHAALDRELVDIAMGRNRRLFVEMPPRHGKSELTSVFFPAWYLGTFPERKVIITGPEARLSAGFSERARDILKFFGRDLFGVSVSESSQAKDHWSTTRGGVCHTVGVGSSIYGYGGDLIVIDDYFGNERDAMSATERDARYKWFHGSVANRLMPGGAIVIVATRYHNDDLIGRLLRDQELGGDQWRRIRFPALAEENDPLGREPGEELWPEQRVGDELRGFSRAWLEQEKKNRYLAGQGYIFESLYQQNPPLTIDSHFPPECFGEHIYFDRWPDPSQIAARIITLDPSLGKVGRGRKSDYSAIIMMALDFEGTMWVDASLDRRDETGIVSDGMEIYRSFGADYFGIEAITFQRLLLPLFEIRGKELGFMPPLVEIQDLTHKDDRILRLGPYLNRGEFRFKRGSSGVNLLIEQLKGFPSHPFRDGPDALEMALQLAAQHVGIGV